MILPFHTEGVIEDTSSFSGIHFCILATVEKGERPQRAAGKSSERSDVGAIVVDRKRSRMLRAPL